jgi:hypothetical protein
MKQKVFLTKQSLKFIFLIKYKSKTNAYEKGFFFIGITVAVLASGCTPIFGFVPLPGCEVMEKYFCPCPNDKS